MGCHPNLLRNTLLAAAIPPWHDLLVSHFRREAGDSWPLECSSRRGKRRRPALRGKEPESGKRVTVRLRRKRSRRKLEHAHVRGSTDQQVVRFEICFQPTSRMAL